MSAKVCTLDCDNVLLDIEEAWKAFIVQEFPLFQYHGGMAHKWNLTECFGLGPERQERMWQFIFGYQTPACDGAVEFVDRLLSRGYEIHVVTARSNDPSLPNNPLKCCMEDLYREFRIKPERVHSDKEKVPVIQNLKSRFHLDDKWTLADSVARRCEGSTTSYLLNRAWNQSLDLDVKYIRVASFQEVLENA